MVEFLYKKPYWESHKETPIFSNKAFLLKSWHNKDSLDKGISKMDVLDFMAFEEWLALAKP